MAIIDRPETFVGWRYLYRHRRSRAVIVTTIALGLSCAASATTFLLVHWAPGSKLQPVLALASVGLLQMFITCLCLNFFSGFTAMSITAVTWGVGALSVVLSVTSGFQTSFQDKVLGVNAHVLVMKYGLDFNEYRDVEKKVDVLAHVKAPSAPFVFNEMMIAHGGSLSGVLVKGIQPERSLNVLDLGQRMVEGSTRELDHPLPLVPGGPPVPTILVGRELARKLRVKVGDSVRVISPLGGLDPSTWNAEQADTKMREFRVGGIFYYGFDEYDRRLAYVDLPEAQAFLEGGDVVTGVEMKLDDIYRSQEVERAVQGVLESGPYRILDWRELNHNLFTALRLQKLALGILLFIKVLVAMFGVIATMTMLVIDKTREIAVLKSLGMRSSAVAATFLTAGMTIGAIGTLCGLLLGLATCGLLSRYSYALDPRVYLIDRLPVRVSPLELGVVAVTTLAVCFLATLLPALRAASLRPVEGLRYE